MQALKSGHTAHHCGDVAQHRVGPHAEDTPRLYARRLRGRVFKRSPRNFRCDPALSKNYLPFGELFADGFLVFALELGLLGAALPLSFVRSL